MFWNADPYIFQIGEWGLTWYGAMWGLMIFLGYYFARFLYRQEKLPEQQLLNMLPYLWIGGLVGARLGQLLFYDWDYFVSSPLTILMIWKGGLASHGGAMGVLIGLYLFNRKYRTAPYAQLLDILSIVLAMGLGFIRIGNLLNSELVGKVTDVPWAFTFAKIDQLPRHPVVLYECLMIWSVGIFLFLLYRYRQKMPPVFRQNGIILSLFLTIAPFLRYLLEFFKEEAVTTQGLNLVFVGIGVLILIFQGIKNLTK